MSRLFFSLIIFLSTQFTWGNNLNAQFDQLNIIKMNQPEYEIALQAGQERATLCGYCHGKNGNSVKKEVPNLAGQNPEYLIKQFNLFAAGVRKNYVMERLAKVVTQEEQVNIALYYASLPVKVDGLSQSSSRGKEVYQSFCFACHGENGRGKRDLPRLAGQKKDFIEKTLTAFKAGQSYRDKSPMVAIMAKISEKDIPELAAYLSAMQ